ncbi:hypothetical protein [Cloacibacillus porcorum]|uniref:hypothetical protein n=1 Tax=Cloacibacillus porcorum TaxID=1197717 RepID=UPI0026734DD8|nr:hypothetical protein [Cloacibacillus porcorum]
MRKNKQSRCFCMGAFSLFILTLGVIMFLGTPSLAQNVNYEIKGLHQSLINEDEATAQIIVPLGLTKDQIMAVCKQAVSEIEKRCDTKMKNVDLRLYHKNTVKIEDGGFTCAHYILDSSGKKNKPENLYFNDNYFVSPSQYQIKGLKKDTAVKLWYDIIRAERKYGVGTDKTEKATASLYKKYGVDPKDENKLILWSMVDNFGSPEK